MENEVLVANVRNETSDLATVEQTVVVSEAFELCKCHRINFRPLKSSWTRAKPYQNRCGWIFARERLEYIVLVDLSGLEVVRVESACHHELDTVTQVMPIQLSTNMVGG